MDDTSEAPRSFDVFISYARTDTAQVERLVARLRDDGFRVWFDRDEMSGGQTTLGQLADGIARSAHMIACLSDSYVDRDYTDFELQTNQSFDPANRQNRTIPVLVRALTKPVPVQIRAFTYGDLTQDENYDREYRRITSMMHRSAAPATASATSARPALNAENVEALCAAALAAQAEPQVALFKARLAAETLARFLYRRELGEPPSGASFDSLCEQLATSRKLPAHAAISLATVRSYGDFAVRQGAEAGAISAESIQPGLAALKALTHWTIATYLRKAGAAESGEGFVSHLPPGDKPDERLIPGTRYVLREPPLGRNRRGTVYAGRDSETGQAVSLLLAPPPQGTSEVLLDAVAQLIRLNEAGVVRPLRCGRIVISGQRVADYAAFETVAGTPASELLARFAQLPELAACELCRDLAQTLEILHAATPPVIHGGVGPGSALVTQYGTVKLVCMLGDGDSTTPVADAEGDLAALRETLAALLGATGTLTQLRQQLQACGSAGEAHRVLDAACRTMGQGTSLRTVVDHFREGKPIPGASAPAPGPAPLPARAAEFGLEFELTLAAAGAWPAGPGRLLAWEEGSGEMLLCAGGTAIWRDRKPVRLRRVVQAPGGRCAAAGWDGQVRCFAPDAEPVVAQLSGTVGDLRFVDGAWIAGTWQQSLVRIGADGALQSVPPAIDAGVFRICATERGDQFAVADLSGGIWLYSGGRRVAGLAPITQVRDLAYCGRRLVVLAGDSMVWIGQDGSAGTPERLPGGQARLVPYRAEGGCLLLAEDGASWALAASGARLPHFRFPSGARVGLCEVPKRFVAPAAEGWEYWRDGSAPVHAWPDALSAELSPDGSQIAIVLPGRVQLWVDPS